MEISEKAVLARRLESGVSTLIYFIYSIFGNFAGIVMAALAMLTTTGLIDHLILAISILGSTLGLLVAAHSMQMERKFINSLQISGKETSLYNPYSLADYMIRVK